MVSRSRKTLSYAGVFLLLIALSGIRFTVPLPQVEFRLQSGADVKTLDPARATGNIEGRVLYELFEGLLRMMPEGEPDPSTGLCEMIAKPGMSESFTISADGKKCTFRLREGIRWTDGSPVTSQDFAWSWQRVLHPETASEYAFHLHGIPYAKAYNEARLEIGDKVEVELWDRPGDIPGGSGSSQNYPRGTVVYGILREIRPPVIFPKGDMPSKQKFDTRNDPCVYVVDLVKLEPDGDVVWQEIVDRKSFSRVVPSFAADSGMQPAHGVLVAFDKLGGLETPDDRTFVVNLESPIPYFPNLTAFYTLFPVNRSCIEKHGSPLWTKPENIVTNGPYKLQLRRLRDRLRLVKNQDYFDAQSVGLSSVDFLSMEGENTALNMYEAGEIDWVTQPPEALRETLKSRKDFLTAPQLSVYFYRLNLSRPPLDNRMVRKALAMAIDRVEIVEQVVKAGQIPAFSIVPPGLAGYKNPSGIKPGVKEARKMLAEAGFEGGRGFPRLTILYNTNEAHRAIAEVIQQQLQNNLNIAVDLQNMEWGSFLDKVQQTDYQIARAGWIADYPDPNTFLDMWVSNNPQNNTNWSNLGYDRLIAMASRSSDQADRLSLLQQAEEIWLDELPAIPIYFHSSVNLVSPRVIGFTPSAQDLHPLKLIRLKNQSP